MAGNFRVINVRTYLLERFNNEKSVKYAILSHRWQDEEVDFQQMRNLRQSQNLRGFKKIRLLCQQALLDGYDYAWIDTCCINKESDAELTEAINSMFRWYQSASVCYLYLSDVRGNRNLRTEVNERSELFERGWTLQELLAPEHVTIFDQDWQLLGNKKSLSSVLANLTNIDEAILRGENLENRSIAQRMSWAAGRKTTRTEDRAYSLLGIFGVYMPTLYGEGENAFLRLQQEIIRQSDDHSIFAWPIQTSNEPGLLASNPDAFSTCGHIIPSISRKGRSPYSITNRGVATKMMAIPWTVDTYFVRLDCVDERVAAIDDSNASPRLGMFLRRLHEDDQYARVMQNEKTFANGRASLWDHGAVVHSEFNVKQNYTNFEDDRKDRINGFRFVTRQFFARSRSGKDRFKVCGPCTFDLESGIMTANPKTIGTVGWLDLTGQDFELKVVKLGFDQEFNPVCFLASSGGLSEKSPNTQMSQYMNESERIKWPGIHQREPYDQLAWNEVGRFANVPALRHGLWALRGDRLEGLSHSLFELCTLRIVRGDWQGKLVWEVYLEDLKSSMAGDFKNMFQRSGKNQGRSDTESSISMTSR